MLIKEERPTVFLAKNKKASSIDLPKLNNMHNFSMYGFWLAFRTNW